jgi:carboxyl-terminal processing protease
LILKNVVIVILSLTLILLVSALALAAIVGQQLGLFDGRFQQVHQYAVLLRELDRRFIGEVDLEEVNIAAMTSAVYALDDRWSFFMTSETLQELLNRRDNVTHGIGINVTLDEDTDGMIVMNVLRGSAAETAGLVIGDIITHVDGTDISGYALSYIVSMMQRQIGESMDLTVIREDGETVILTPIFSEIFINPVEYELLYPDIGLITIANFNKGSANEVLAATESLLEQNARAFIFDVRSNGGGQVHEMTAMLDRLLPEGEIFITVDSYGNEDIIFSDAEMLDVPAVVLVDRNSFSAAEFFAAIMREFDYAIIVGEQTSGKSRMQTVLMLPEGNAVNLSTAEYLTKNRVSLEEVGGVTPDYFIEFTDDQFTDFIFGNLDIEDDPHIQKALYLLGIN